MSNKLQRPLYGDTIQIHSKYRTWTTKVTHVERDAMSGKISMICGEDGYNWKPAIDGGCIEKITPRTLTPQEYIDFHGGVCPVCLTDRKYHGPTKNVTVSDPILNGLCCFVDVHCLTCGSTIEEAYQLDGFSIPHRGEDYKEIGGGEIETE